MQGGFIKFGVSVYGQCCSIADNLYGVLENNAGLRV